MAPVCLAGLALATLAACSSPTVSPAAGNTVGPVGPKVQRVVLAVAPPATEGNDMGPMSAPALWPLRPMYEDLIAMDAKDGSLVPRLATEWSLEPDGASYRFKLQRGVKYHKGFGEFTAKDLAPNLVFRATQPEQRGAVLYFQRNISGVEVVNDYEAVYHFTAPNSTFFYYASEQSAALLQYSPEHARGMGTPTMDMEPWAGTGPYQFKERRQNEFIRYERTPFQHWRITPDFPEFEFRWVKEASTRMAALLAGEVQLASLPEDLQADALGRGYRNARGTAPGSRTFINFYCCYFNDLKDPSKGYRYPDSPLMDVRVRRALSKAIRRDDLNKAFFRGKAEPMYLNSYHPALRGWDPSWEKRFQDEYGYDPDAARKLLADAGYGPARPLTTTMLVGPASGYSGAEDLAEAVVAFWRQVGVQTTLDNMDSVLRTANQRNYKFDNHAAVIGTGAEQWAGLSQYSSTIGPPGNGVHLAEMDRLVSQVERTVEAKRNQEFWKQAGELEFTSHQFVPLFWLPVDITYDPKTVASYTFPGAITGSWGQVENIKAAK